VITVEEFARRLGVSYRTAQRIVALRKVETYREGRIVRIPAAEVERYIAARLVRRAPLWEAR
jgi:excisionase family DNA binding protein